MVAKIFSTFMIDFMTKKVNHTEAAGIISDWLVGAGIQKLTYFITGWEIWLLDEETVEFKLVAAELTVPNIEVWRNSFSALPIDLLDTNEPDDVIIAAHLFSAFNKSRVEEVSLNETGDLILRFNNLVVIRAEAKVDLVDWAWSLKNTSTNKVLTCDSGPLFLSHEDRI